MCSPCLTLVQFTEPESQASQIGSSSCSPSHLQNHHMVCPESSHGCIWRHIILQWKQVHQPQVHVWISRKLHTLDTLQMPRYQSPQSHTRHADMSRQSWLSVPV